MAVRKLLAALTLLYAFVGCLLLSGCGDGGAPVTVETSKFKPVDSTIKQPREESPATVTPEEAIRNAITAPRPAELRRSDVPPPGEDVALNTTPGEAAVKPTTPSTKNANPPAAANPGEISVTKGVADVIAAIEQLQQADPPGNTQEEQAQNMVEMQRKIVQLSSLLLSEETDPRVHRMAMQSATQSLAMLGRLGDPSAPTRMTIFAKALTKHPTPEISRTGRLLIFNMDIVGKLHAGEKVDTELILKEIEKFLAADGGDVDAFQVSTSVCQFLSERGESAAAAKGMRIVAAAYKDSKIEELAEAARALPDSARVVELDLPQKLSDVLSKKEGAEAKIVAEIETLFKDKNPNFVFVQPVMDLIRRLELAGNSTLVLKLMGQLETAYSTHENAEWAKIVNEQIVTPIRKRYGVVGQPFAPQAVSADGDPIDLKPHAGKVLLVSLWGPHAPTSLQELPLLRMLHEDLSNKGFAVIGLNVDTDLRRVEKFMSFQGGSIPFDNFLSPEVARGEKVADWHLTALSQQFGLQSLPVYLLVGKDGKVDSLYHFKLDPERLGGRLKELLGLEEIPVFAVKPKPMLIENPTLPKATPLPAEAPPPPPAPAPKSEAPKAEAPKQSRLEHKTGDEVSRLVSTFFAPLALNGALFAEEEPKKDEPAKESNPYLAKPNQSATQLTDWVLRMLDKPKTIQGRPGFAAAIVEACDRVLADKSAKESEQLVAIENKLAILHKAACAGDDALDKQLAAFVAQLKDDSRPRVAREIAFFAQERKVLDASEAKPEEIAAILKEMQDYYAKEKLASKHLRMASATIDLINKLEDGDAREKHFTDFGNLFAKSSDKELAGYGKKLAKKPGTKESDLIGKPLELAGNTAGGLPFAWDKYRGKVVIVDFWATWCGPCLKEMPNVKAFREKHKDKGFDIVGVSVDKDLDALETFLDENDLPWETLAGEEAQAAAGKYGVRAIPTMMLIDQKGNVVAVAHNIAALAPEAEKLLAAGAKK